MVVINDQWFQAPIETGGIGKLFDELEADGCMAETSRVIDPVGNK